MTIAAASSNAGGAAVTIIFVIIGIGMYFIPTIVAKVRGVSNLGSVAVINVFLGWTFVGWIIALAMACKSVYQVNITDQRRHEPTA